MSSNPLVQELISHIDAADHPDTLQVIFNWTAAKLAEERIASKSSSSSRPTDPSSPTSRSSEPMPSISVPTTSNGSSSFASPFGNNNDPSKSSSSSLAAAPLNQARRGSALSNTPAANSLFTSGPFGVDSSGPLMSLQEEDGTRSSFSSTNSSPSSAAFPPSSSAGGSSNFLNVHAFPPGFAAGRRTSVSAESLIPTSAGTNTGSKPQLPVYPKTPQQLSRIKLSIAQNFLFRNLDDDQERDVLNAMKEVKVQAGEKVIEQGAVGDYFYVVEEGSLDVFKAKPGEETAPGDIGAKVYTNLPGTSFGELALMYNAPRAASIVANQPCTLWALDRITFRTILLDHTSSKRKMYESFLGSIPILTGLEPYERAKIADALEARTYDAGREVIKEGEVGEEFFIIESGRAQFTKMQKGEDGTVSEVVVAEYGKGDYFGELALINRAPRAATVRAVGGKLKLAALGEKAFTRLLGPTKDIMARKAGERYGLN